MKKCLAVFLIFFVSTIVFAEDYAYFPDELLENLIAESLGCSAPIPMSKLDGLGDVTSNNIAIEDLTGLDQIKWLRYLTIFNANVSTLEPLRNATRLWNVRIGYNQLTDISPLSGLSDLKRVDVTKNQITDITPLANLKLKSLNISCNNVSDISTVSNFRNYMTNFYASDNHIEDISCLSGMYFYSLDLGGNKIKDISSLSNCYNLSDLNVRNNQITDLTSISQLPCLSVVDISGNQTTDLSPLSQLPLTQLYANNNLISDISSLAYNEDIEILHLNGNKISDVSPLQSLRSSLKELWIEDNRITDISPLFATEYPALQKLQASGNKIATLDVSTEQGTRYLYLNDNELSDLLWLEFFPHLKKLYVENNNITDLAPLLDLDYLTSVHLEGNPISIEQIETYVPLLEEKGVLVYYDVPEPASLIVLASGVLFLNRRRKQRYIGK